MQDDGAQKDRADEPALVIVPAAPKLSLLVRHSWDGDKSFDARVSHNVRRQRTHLQTDEAPSDGLPASWLIQNCAMKFQASGGMKAFRPSSPVEVPSSTLAGVCAPSNVHTLTG